MDVWLTERETDNLRVQWRIVETLHREQSPYQEIAVVESAEFGRMLVLDGVIQTTLRDEFVYHEMLAHIPLFTHPSPERVLVIGGGDGGTVREALKHPEVKKVELVEIDKLVIDVCKTYLPALAKSFDDPRVDVFIADGVEYIRNRRTQYDVVLVDSSDPLGPAEGLFTAEFYAHVARSLKRDGIMAVQSGSPFFTPDLVHATYHAIADAFASTHLYTAGVPSYSPAPWSFTLGAKRFDALQQVRRGRGIRTRYYSPDIHKAAFILPAYIDELLSGAQRKKGASTA